MKTAVFILLFALGVMWYRGDIGFGHRPAEFGLPGEIPKALTTDSLTQAREAGLAKKNATPEGRMELLTPADVALLKGKDREAYDKWLAKLQQERGFSDKLVNFFSHGKYE